MRPPSPARRGVIVLAVILMAVSVATASVSVLAVSGAWAQAGNDADCSLDSTGKTPIIDLGDEAYQGAEGGLYPGGSNEIPAAHEALGMLRASEITPLDADGDPDPNGKIVFASVGVSNTRREFTAFLAAAGADPALADTVVLVNGAQNGEPVSSWLDPGDSVWNQFERALLEAEVTPAQVQAVWAKIPERYTEAPAAFPGNIFDYRNMLAAAMRTLQDKLPNVQVAYLSSRIYGGYNAVTSSNPEPNAYEEGFGVKWLIEEQMAGNPVVNADPRQGTVESPWLAWGPYLWADGTNPRSDGLVWECGDINADGIHPNGNGSDKVAALLLDFLHGEPTATWLFGEPVAAGNAPSPGGVTATSLPGDPGLSEATLPVPAAPSGQGQGDGPAGTTAAPGDAGATTGDASRRERREQQRAEREARRQTEREQEGEAAAPPVSQAPGATIAAPVDRQAIEDVPPLVWVFAGAGAATLLLLLARFVREKARRSGEESPPAT